MSLRLVFDLGLNFFAVVNLITSRLVRLDLKTESRIMNVKNVCMSPVSNTCACDTEKILFSSHLYSLDVIHILNTYTVRYFDM